MMGRGGGGAWFGVSRALSWVWVVLMLVRRSRSLGSVDDEDEEGVRILVAGSRCRERWV